MAPVLRQVYDQMVEPKWVISMGVCASTGGMFNNYAIVQGVDQIVPVDVYAPGCPPGPETLIHSIVTLHTKIQSGEIIRRRGETGAGAAFIIEAPSSLPVSASQADTLMETGTTTSCSGVPGATVRTIAGVCMRLQSLASSRASG